MAWERVCVRFVHNIWRPAELSQATWRFRVMLFGPQTVCDLKVHEASHDLHTTGWYAHLSPAFEQVDGQWYQCARFEHLLVSIGLRCALRQAGCCLSLRETAI